jgi:zinc and cadmium transporter
MDASLVSGVFESPAILASLGAALLATIGIALAMLNRGLAQANGAYVSGFAAGLLVASAILHLIPGALSEGLTYAFWILGGFVGMYLIGEVFRCGAGSSQSLAAAGVAVGGIGLHSLIDGFSYPVLFEYDVHTGWLAVAGLMLHELAEGVIVYMLLRTSGLRASLSAMLAFVAAGLTTPAGALASAFAFPQLDANVQHILLSIAAGAVLYVGAGHLPRHIPQAKRMGSAMTFLMGVALALILLALNPDHGHGHGHGHVHHHDHIDHGPMPSERGR